jgi:hypothetical protein
LKKNKPARNDGFFLCEDKATAGVDKKVLVFIEAERARPVCLKKIPKSCFYRNAKNP